MNNLQVRINTLASYHASPSEIEELLAYNQNLFKHENVQYQNSFPLLSEPHIAAWEEYVIEAKTRGVYSTLKAKLKQFQFPILSGISQTQDYIKATLAGNAVEGMSLATGLVLQEPEKLQLIIHPTLAGAIPVIIAGVRQDFITLVQALGKKNEPQPLPESMGAVIIGGYNNWDRISQYKKQWSAKNPDNCSKWDQEFKKIIPCKQLYQDRLIILSPGFYSNVPPTQLGLNDKQWLELSLKIRLEHESTHYFTRRLFGSMRNNLLDELIADYRGIVVALGHYNANWFLHFLGLELFPLYRHGGRLENYRGSPPLSDGAFAILQALIITAAKNLECFDQQYFSSTKNLLEEVAMMIALTTLTIEELASKQSLSLLETAFNQIIDIE